MLDMSWGEVMVIGAVALIVIGPKDLPKALRTLGQFTSRIRRMAAEFQGQFNEAMREAELDEVKRQIQGVNDQVGSLNQGFNPIQTVRDELKGAIEGPAAPEKATAAGSVPAVADQTGDNTPPAPAAEPAAALALPPVPPVADPADSLAAAGPARPGEAEDDTRPVRIAGEKA
jgi:sec-independent protein translocase protein TatB